MSKILPLEWDSNFFGFNVGRVVVDDEFDLSNVIEKSRKACLELLYVYTTTPLSSIQLVKDFNGELVDKKVTLSFDLSDTDLTQDIYEIEDVSTLCPELIELAIESGIYSRFKVDLNFEKGKFEEMYTKWIANSVSGKIADNVLVATKNKGVITVKHDDGESLIGLLAVSKSSRGEKIGSKLISKTKNICYKKNQRSLKVITQLDNETAVKFYEHNGFEIEKVEYIYHFWLK